MSRSRLLLLTLLIFSTGCQSGSGQGEQVHPRGHIQEWTAYGGRMAARYSPLDDIDRHNVDSLEVAWRHRSGDFSDGSGEWTYTSLQVSPLMVGGYLYYCTPFGRVFALNAETGLEHWVFDPDVKNKRSGLYPALCRGVAVWQQDGDGAGPCRRRILYGTRDAELIALDAETGRPCESFGQGGRVALKEGIEGARPWEYYPTSPPYVIGNVAVIGASVPDNERIDVPSGVVRAFDVRTGELVWAWDPVSDDYRRRHSDLGGSTRYHRGTPNVWAPISGDPDLGLVYVPTGNPSPDLYGGERDGIDHFGSSVVALDAATGEVRWHFQTVHHDVWDYDVAAQPTLVDLPPANGEHPRKGLVQGTKMGHIFLLDRLSGEPLYPVEERPVPQGGVPGEQLSPTQPFPTHPGPLHLPERLSGEDMEGFAWVDRRACQREFAKYRSEGMFTPPTLRGSILYPSTTGGINWGGLSIDPVNRRLFVNQMHLASVVQLIPRAEYDALNPSPGYPLEHYPMHGTPYGVRRFPLMSPLGAPCNPRPWGTLTAVDLDSGKISWRVTLGTTRGQAPWPLWLKTGSPNIGGPLTTAGDLVFIGATTDRYLRAYDATNGRELWRADLPFTANATPITYRASEGGKQFLVIAAGGHGWSEPGDVLIAYALP
jgi:quinoprotein glucose dehydrogenase